MHTPDPEDPNDVAEGLAIAGRDAEAFGRWFARHEARLRRSLRSFAGRVDIEGVVQETALRLWNAASSIDPPGSRSFLAWALTVARRLAIDQARRVGREEALDEGEGVEPPDPRRNEPADPALDARIRACRDELPRKPAQVLAARIEDGGVSPDRALAATIGMSFDAFRQNQARARKLLAACLERHGIDVRRWLR